RAIMTATNEAADKLKSFDNVIRMQRQNHPRGYENPYGKNPYFPNIDGLDWTEDNYGPIWIPKKGATVKLDRNSLPFYERVIRIYEGHDLQVNGDQILIDGQPADN